MEPQGGGPVVKSKLSHFALQDSAVSYESPPNVRLYIICWLRGKGQRTRAVVAAACSGASRVTRKPQHEHQEKHSGTLATGSVADLRFVLMFMLWFPCDPR